MSPKSKKKKLKKLKKVKKDQAQNKVTGIKKKLAKIRNKNSKRRKRQFEQNQTEPPIEPPSINDQPQGEEKTKPPKRKKSKQDQENPDCDDPIRQDKSNQKTKKRKKAKKSKVAEEEVDHKSTDLEPSVAHQEENIQTSEQPSNSETRQVQDIKTNGGVNGVRSFRRVADEEWLGKKGAWNNSYSANFGTSGWGAKAQSVLGQVKGKNFRHEKTKKKRGTYFGGKISTHAVNSFKFESDDE